jgi:hypothetical protein
MVSQTNKLAVKVSAVGNVTVLADETLLSSPNAIAADSSGNVYVLDSMDQRVCVIPAGTTGACTVVPAFGSGSLSGAGLLTSDANGNNLCVVNAMTSNITRINSDGSATPLFFSPSLQLVGGGSGNFAWDTAGSMYAITGNTIVKYVLVSGTNYTGTLLAGSGQARFADGTGTAASFNAPQGLAVDSSFNVIVADSNNYRLRKVTPAGVVTTIAGCGTTSTAAACTANSLDTVMGISPLATTMFLSFSGGVFMFGNSPALLSGGSVQYMIVAPSPPPPSPPFAPSGTNVAVCVRAPVVDIYHTQG